MVIVLLGPPGAGKGTQAKNIVKKYNITHISTGEIFRKHIEENTPLGILAGSYINKGQLVPDEVTISIVRDRISAPDCSRGFLMDGFPRTIVQADEFNQLLSSAGKVLNHVISIDVTEDNLIKRLTGRRICTVCGASFHVVFNPPKAEGHCDYCQGKLTQRVDDGIEAVSNRLDIYRKQTEPLIEYYKGKQLLRVINGEQGTEKVFDDICNVLGAEMDDLFKIR
jgi:adenylate kinase